MSLNQLTIREAHAKLKAKAISAVELTKACLDSIEAQNQKLNAYVLVTKDLALESAKVIDDKIAKGENLGALAGIPCGLKDVFCTDGIRTTACSNILRDFVPPYDAVSVERLKQEGLVLLGKTNTDEFTCGASSETSCFGVTRNPWDLERVAGGSSGGSAAAITADMAIYTLGTDTGGSIRQPAAFCNACGLKVTYGRVPRTGVIAMASSWDTIGPFAKNAYDLALIMNVIAGVDERDSTTPKVEVPDYTKTLDGQVKGLTLGLPKEYLGEGVTADTKEAVLNAAKEFEKLGAKVKEVSLPYTKYAVAVYYVAQVAETSSNMTRYDGLRFGPGPKAEAKDLYDYYLKARGEGFGPEMKRRIMVGTYVLSAGYYDAYYLKALKVRTLICRDFDNAFKEVDALIAPVSPFPAFKIGEKSFDPVAMYLADALTIPANAAGIPALSIPGGFSQDKLPIGLQIIGPQFREDLLLKIGDAYQRVTDWHLKKADGQ